MRRMASTVSTTFEEQLGQFEREIRLHCYRLTGSLQDSKDLYQETLIRAWQKRESLRDASKLRAWLYQIATNAYLDQVKLQKRRALPQARYPAADAAKGLPRPNLEVQWVEPFPDALLPETDGDPELSLIAKEDISLAFMASIQALPPQQRAALILVDVLDWTAQETAEALGNSLSSVNSLLYRARKRMQKQGAGTAGQPLEDEAQRALLAQYVEAWERSDVEGLSRLLKEEAIFYMPPFPSWFAGKASILDMVRQQLFDEDQAEQWQLERYDANGQPAFRLRRWNPDASEYTLFGLMVLSVDADGISEMAAFLSPELFPYIEGLVTWR